MKVVCPVCGRMGFLEVRGNSGRVVHYVGFHEGKRIYEKHNVGNQSSFLHSGGRGFKSRPVHPTIFIVRISNQPPTLKPNHNILSVVIRAISMELKSFSSSSFWKKIIRPICIINPC